MTDQPQETKESLTKRDLMQMTSSIVAAHISKNMLPLTELPDLVRHVFHMLKKIDNETQGHLLPKPQPAVSIEDSVHDEYIVCLEDGKKLQMLKRHLKAVYKMSLDEYKERWNLPSDYPVVAPNYARRRSQIARKTGLGLTGRRGRIKIIKTADQKQAAFVKGS
jgi:predicted transcriptional regulator